MQVPTHSFVRLSEESLDTAPPLTAVRGIRPNRLNWAMTSATPGMQPTPVSTSARPNERFGGRAAEICSGEGMRLIRLIGSFLNRRGIVDLLARTIHEYPRETVETDTTVAARTRNGRRHPDRLSRKLSEYRHAEQEDRLSQQVFKNSPH